MISTYRLQLHPDFDFEDAQKLLPYFSQLGISHLYLSPITEAREGSTHGYDVVDHNSIREELGGEEGFERLRTAAVDEGMGIVLDFVPNHAGVGPQNVTWQKLLCYGPYAETARHFDVDWLPLKPELREKVLLPFLGKSYGEALDGGEISLVFEQGRFYASYYDNRFALNPATYLPILQKIARRVRTRDVADEINDVADALNSVSRSNRKVCERLRMQMVESFTPIVEDIDLTELLNSEDMHDLLEEQYWRLAYWKTAGSEINYRRFFTINELVALRMEDATVFEQTHKLLRDLLHREGVDGVRIDHIDGLYDPHDYLDQLQNLGIENIWVEKIIAPGETMPEAWPVRGATGYGFMNDSMGVLLQTDGEAPLNRLHRRFVLSTKSFDEIILEAKIEIMQESLTSERSRLAYELDRISEQDYHYRDFTLDSLQSALTEVIACLDRYRTYLPYEADDDTTELIREVVHRARQLRGAEEPTVYDFIGDVLTGDVYPDLEQARRGWIGRLQQYTAPVAAKGVEDTAFYRYYRLAALNEVGGEPGHFGTSNHAFHSHCQFRASRYPHHLLATSTHDHKRGEDTRMRLVALAELPEQWEQAVIRLEEIADDYQSDDAPSRSDLYLFFQTAVALLSDTNRDELTERLSDYMQKAAREAKLHTTWAKPDEAYESALTKVVQGVLTDTRVDELKPLADTLADLGFRNSLTQLLLKLTTPGVPDFYQGSELFDLSLVDPDNRRPVDYETRKQLLQEIQPILEEPLVDQLSEWLRAREPRLKLYVIAQILRLRNQRPRLFTHASHRKIDISGSDADRWIAFTRGNEESTALVVTSRYHASIGQNETAAMELPADDNSWKDVITGTVISQTQEELLLHSLDFPWAVFMPD